MTIKRMDHVGIVVEDLADAVAFFAELGLELEGEAQVEGDWVDRVVGLEGVRAQIAMLQTPDGHGRPGAARSSYTPASDGDHQRAAANTLGIRHVSFAVEDIDRPSSPASALAVANSSASWGVTGTATGSATFTAPRGSSSSWPRKLADRFGRPALRRVPQPRSAKSGQRPGTPLSS